MKFILSLLVIAAVLSSCKKSTTTSRQPEPGQTISTALNVKYGSNVTWTGLPQDLLMDIYVPKNTTAESKHPFILLIHGGSFLSGTKDNLADMCTILADSGFVAATMEYRLGWDKGTDICNGDTLSNKEALYRSMQDANAALRYMTANASSYGIDTSWLFIGGKSAGAVTALNTTYINETLAQAMFSKFYGGLGSLTSSDNNLTNSFKIKGIASMWGAVLDSTLITNTTAVPTIFYHGDQDSTIPVNVGTYNYCSTTQVICGSLCMDRRLRKANTTSIVDILPGGGHGPDEFTDQFLSENIACFLRRIVKGIPITSQHYSGVVSSCE